MSILDRYPTASAADLVAALKARAVSSSELVEQAISRIEALDGPLNAVVVRDFERARAAANGQDALLAKGEGGPLAGLPMTVKESFDLEGFPSTWGMTEYFEQHRAQTAALVVQRLRAAGAVILGKTNVPPMLADWQSNNPVYGRTNNPYDVTRSPGGSSGGSAASVAAGFVALEYGTDIGGSVRIPAAFCGVYGHKSTFGLVPLQGHTPGGRVGLAPPMGVAGPLARTASDLALALNITAGPTPEEAVSYALNLAPPRHARLGDFRVLILDRHPKARVDSEILAAIDRIAQKVGAAGGKVGRLDPALPDLSLSHKTYLTMLRTVTSRRGPVGNGRDPLTAFAWLDALDAQLAIRQAWAEVFRNWDIVLAPALGVPAFPHIEDFDAPDWRDRRLMLDGEPTPYGDQLAWPGMANLANLPSTAFPAGFTKDGLPVGLQAIGPYLEDLTAIKFAELAGEPFTPPKL